MRWGRLRIKAQDWLELWRLRTWLLEHMRQIDELRDGLAELERRVEVATKPRACIKCEALLQHPYVLHENGGECLPCWRKGLCDET